MNHIAIPAGRFFDILPNGLSVNRESVAMQHPGSSHFSQDGGEAASVVEILHQIFPGRLQIHEAGKFCAKLFEVVELERDTDAASDCDQMDDCVRRSAHGCIRSD